MVQHPADGEAAMPPEHVQAIVDDTSRGDFVTAFVWRDSWILILARVTHAAAEGGDGDTWGTPIGGTEAMKLIFPGESYWAVQRWRPYVEPRE